MQHPGQPGPARPGEWEPPPCSAPQNQSRALGSDQPKPVLLLLLRFPEQEQETPLHCAAWHGYSAVALALCQAGCNVDAKNREGESPLLTASARGFVDIVQCLVEHGAHLEASDKVGHTDCCHSFMYVCVLYITYANTYVCMCMYTCIHMYILMHICVFVHRYMWTYIYLFNS